MGAPRQVAANVQLDDARAYGQHLAEMLAASHFSAENKEAWAFLIPEMTPEQLGKFDAILRADMTAKTTHELEDLIISIRAAQHKRDLSLAALDAETDKAFDDLEEEIEAAG